MRAPCVLAALLALFASVAEAGEVDARLGTDFMRGSTGGEGASFVAQEVGVRFLLNLDELEDRLHVYVDYRGREPVGGDVQNLTLRLVYRAEVAYELIPDTLTLSVGRFVARAALFLPVDAVKAELVLGRLSFTAFGGRRAIDSTRRNVAFGDLLPAAGASVGWTDRSLQLALEGAFAKDQLPLVSQPDQAVEREVDAASVNARVYAQPLGVLGLGGELAFTSQAGYTLGPTWSSVELDVVALDVYGASWFADYRPARGLRFDYRGQYQRAGVFSSGLQDGSVQLLDPNFFDNRVGAAWAPWDMGWVRASARLRLRDQRRELRYGLSVEVDDLGLDGPLLEGRVFYDDLELEGSAQVHDRLLWYAAAGYRGLGLDVRAGVSFVERTAAPVSGTTFDPRTPGQPVDSTELTPFVLAAQRVAFLRAFYSGTWWYGGADVEKALSGRGLRLMVQIGALWGTSW
jgi:hypothetical protein